jgi:hypothetical protein
MSTTPPPSQDAVRELGGLTLIARYLSDPAADVRVQTLNALNNLSMNLKNQDVLKVCHSGYLVYLSLLWP